MNVHSSVIAKKTIGRRSNDARALDFQQLEELKSLPFHVEQLKSSPVGVDEYLSPNSGSIITVSFTEDERIKTLLTTFVNGDDQPGGIQELKEKNLILNMERHQIKRRECAIAVVMANLLYSSYGLCTIPDSLQIALVTYFTSNLPPNYHFKKNARQTLMNGTKKLISKVAIVVSKILILGFLLHEYLVIFNGSLRWTR